MKFVTQLVLACLAFLATAQSVCAIDLTALGGDMTSNFPADSDPRFMIQQPTPNISSQELYQYHLLGFVDFHRNFVGETLNGKPVLGPHFVHNSCGSCHTQNGKGRIGFKSGLGGTSMVVKVSLQKLNSDGSPKNVPELGVGLLQNHSLKGKELFNLALHWRIRHGKYPDGKKYTLRKPKLTFDLPGVSPVKKRHIVHSLRMTSPMIGMGLLDFVPDETIEALADPDDLNADGISGRVSYVPNIETGLIDVGRMGFKATHPSVIQQTAAAFSGDMGMGNDFFPGKNNSIEVGSDILDRVTFYLQAAGVPYARNQSDPDVIAGQDLFTQVGCDDCHIMTLQTEDSPVVETAHQTFHPFTDMLLHDMGSGLADGRLEFSSNGKEWRTTPLWGIGLTGKLNNFKPGYLHDGRGRTLEEAILWHGGEAKASRNNFKGLTLEQRNQLIKFLESL